MTAIAVASAMRIRTALPSSGARTAGARLCSVWAGSGHCIRAPNGEREGVVRSGLSPQGVRPVVYSPWIDPGCRLNSASRAPLVDVPNLDQSQYSGLTPVFRLQLGSPAHSMHPKAQSGFAMCNLQDHSSNPCSKEISGC